MTWRSLWPSLLFVASGDWAACEHSLEWRSFRTQVLKVHQEGKELQTDGELVKLLGINLEKKGS